MQTPAKIAVGSAIILLLSLGLCGLALSQMNSENSGSIASLSFVGMGIGVLGLILAAILAIINAVSRPPK